MSTQHHVCLTCGYNMVGYHPARCPFCGAGCEHFLTIEETSARYAVQATFRHGPSDPPQLGAETGR